MKLHRFVIGFILGSSLTVLVAGLWFHRPAAESAKPAPAAATPALSLPPLSPGARDSVLAAKR
ncbi:MAG TPA: hypothetical protein VL860_13545 [Planctomycetota bacterium]|nr:hypothetical protein [Planctomycetota bacterium]